jgi:tRNA uridine 5-carboxymethylaminomethyl modification enzyme
VAQVELETKYAGYIARQSAEIERTRNLADKKIPEPFDYSEVPSLGSEARQKLTRIRPLTVGQASRIPGVSPADISVLIVWLKRAGPTGPGAATSPSEAPDPDDLNT